MIDLSPVYARLPWWCCLPLLIPLILGLKNLTVYVVCRVRGRQRPWWGDESVLVSAIIAMLLVPILFSLFMPDMKDVTSQIEQATGVTRLQCEAGTILALKRNPPTCTFLYKGAFQQGMLTVDDDDQATLYRTIQGAPIPVTGKDS